MPWLKMRVEDKERERWQRVALAHVDGWAGGVRMFDTNTRPRVAHASGSFPCDRVLGLTSHRRGLAKLPPYGEMAERSKAPD